MNTDAVVLLIVLSFLMFGAFQTAMIAMSISVMAESASKLDKMLKFAAARSVSNVALFGIVSFFLVSRAFTVPYLVGYPSSDVWNALILGTTSITVIVLVGFMASSSLAHDFWNATKMFPKWSNGFRSKDTRNRLAFLQYTPPNAPVYAIKKNMVRAFKLEAGFPVFSEMLLITALTFMLFAVATTFAYMYSFSFIVMLLLYVAIFATCVTASAGFSQMLYHSRVVRAAKIIASQKTQASSNITPWRSLLWLTYHFDETIAVRALETIYAGSNVPSDAALLALIVEVENYSSDPFEWISAVEVIQEIQPSISET